MMDSNYVKGKQSVLVKQRVTSNIRVVITFVLAIALVAASLVPRTYAATVNNSPNTLKVSPVRSDISIPAGTSKTVQTTVTNLTKSPISVMPIENDFIAGDERGTPALILDADKFAPTHSLKRYMVPLTNVVIPPNQGKTVNVVINVPKDAQPGGYFGAIRFAPSSPASAGGQVDLSASVASIILMTVPGPTVEKLSLTNFDIQQNGRTDAFFQSPDDIQVALRFKNDGNLQEGPFGKVSVKEGNNVVYQADFNNKDPRDVVLPDSARRWEVPLKNFKKFGHYTVYATFTYGAKNQTIEVNKSFWIIPMSYIIGAVIALIVLILLIIGIVFGLRGYKKRILGGSGRRGYRR